MPMRTPYDSYVDPRASTLLRDLAVLAPSVARFDRALGVWLERVFTARDRSNGDDGAIGLPLGLFGSDEDAALQASLEKLEGPARLYAWARLWKAYDALCDGPAAEVATGRLLARHLIDAQPEHLDAEALLALHRYFEDMVDSSTSGLYHALWEWTEATGLFSPRAGSGRDTALLAFVRLLERRRFHHQLLDLRRVLQRLRAEDEATMRALRGFGRRHHQGAALFAGEVIRAIGLREEARRPGGLAAKALRCFFGAGARPSPRSCAARRELASVIGEETLRNLARWVGARPQLELHRPSGQRDELYSSALRAVEGELFESARVAEFKEAAARRERPGGLLGAHPSAGALRAVR